MEPLGFFLSQAGANLIVAHADRLPVRLHQLLLFGGALRLFGMERDTGGFGSVSKLGIQLALLRCRLNALNLIADLAQLYLS